jgi:hypothetical protein
VLPTEIEENINELETRVDRLRALYEQYFMGIEKIEPHVARKDVERRVQSLRREQIRNTALRFRFHMIIQRYNTFQSYWLRVCRAIEEGTYKRDVLRAQAKFGDGKLPKWHRKRFWKKGETEATPPPEESAAEIDEFLEEEEITKPKLAPPPLAPKGSPGKPPPPPLPGRSGKAPPLPAGASSAPAATAPAPTAPDAARISPATPATLATPVSPAAAAAAAAGQDANKEDRMRELARRLSEKGASGGAGRPGSERQVPAAKPTPEARPPSERRLEAAPAPAAAASTNGRPAAKEKDLSEERMRQLYGELVETKRRQKESTAAVTYEAMVKTLKESSQKIKEKHAGRSVDFEVTVKDGKTILRPVVK